MASVDDSGSLAIVASPIGNLEDMTFRAVRVLGEADLIAAEDTRRARKLLDHYDIGGRVTSYHAHNEHRKTKGLLDQVAAGKKVAVLSDAGTPAISDPGFLIVRAALRQGIDPVIIPGVSALTFAVVACGFPVNEFCFAGFLPQKSGKRRAVLARLAAQGQTFFLFESPHRIGRLLREIVENVGAQAQVALIREATKLYEERLRGSAAELLAAFGEKKWKGELTIAVQPAPPEDAAPEQGEA